MSDLAFWLRPDWRGGCNLRDPGTQPFWMFPPVADPSRSTTPKARVIDGRTWIEIGNWRTLA